MLCYNIYTRWPSPRAEAELITWHPVVRFCRYIYIWVQSWIARLTLPLDAGSTRGSKISRTILKPKAPFDRAHIVDLHTATEYHILYSNTKQHNTHIHTYHMNLYHPHTQTRNYIVLPNAKYIYIDMCLYASIVRQVCFALIHIGHIYIYFHISRLLFVHDAWDLFADCVHHANTSSETAHFSHVVPCLSFVERETQKPRARRYMYIYICNQTHLAKSD